MEDEVLEIKFSSNLSEFKTEVEEAIKLIEQLQEKLQKIAFEVKVLST